MTALYNIKSNSKGWQITKFDGDLNPDTSYQMVHMDGTLNCTCPQMAKPKCRHRTMFPEFVLKARIDTNWFFDYDTKQWRQYVGPFDGADDVSVNVDITQQVIQPVIDKTLEIMKRHESESPATLASPAGDVEAPMSAEQMIAGMQEIVSQSPKVGIDHYFQSPAPQPPAGDQAGGEQLASPSPPAQFKRRV